ncbi:translocation/assembly module TamB domain-containing protein [Synechococcus elongatus]|uniref:translocation/assembly module TamB domain-containing protein n=1 Tax=Synechococcus elongatus TaxID=32046 RepID=UPI000F7E7D04|nr:translocation/assembly module TamB [Synechococcus elongatus]
MVASPEPHAPNPPSRRRAWWMLGGGLVLAGGVWVGLGGPQRLAETWLIPQAEQQLTAALGQPIQLGNIEGWNWDGVRLGQSQLGTVSGPSFVSWQTTTVGIDWAGLFQGRLPLQLRLENVDASLQQLSNGQWYTFPTQAQISEYPDLKLVVAGGKLSLQPRNTQNQLLVPIRLSAIAGHLQLSQEQRARFQATAQLSTGQRGLVAGEIQGGRNGEIRLRSQQVALPEVQRLLAQTLRLPAIAESGTASGNLSLQLRDQQVTAINGSAQLQSATLKATEVPVLLQQVTAALQFQDRQITVQRGTARWQDWRIQGQGNWTFDQGGTIQLTTTASSSTARSPLPGLKLGGPLQAQLNIEQAREAFRGAIVLTPAAGTTWQGLALGRATAQYQLDAKQLRVQQGAITIAQQGQLSLQGSVGRQASRPIAFTADLRGLSSRQLLQNLGAAVPTDLELGSLIASGQIRGTLDRPEAEVRWQTTAQQQTVNGQIFLNRQPDWQAVALVQTGRGAIQARLTSQGDRWQGDVQVRDLPLQLLTADLGGQASGQIQLNGSLNALSLTTVQADSRLALTNLAWQGQRWADGQANLDWGWDGQQLALRQFATSGLVAQGQVRPNATADQQLQIGLNIQQVALQTLPLPLPLQGNLGFQGRLVGRFQAPQLEGDLQIRDVGWSAQRRRRDWLGNLRYNQQGLQVALSSSDGQLLAQTDRRFQLQNFRWQQSGGVIEAKAQGSDLRWQADNFSIAGLNLPSDRGIPLVTSGRVSGEGRLNLQRGTGSGNLSVLRPRLGYVRGDRLNAQFQLGDGWLTLTEATLARDNSLYSLQGRVQLAGTGQVSARLEAKQGNPQELAWFLRSLQRSGFLAEQPEFADAAAIASVPGIDDTATSLYQQLQRLSQLQALQQQEQAQQPLPTLPTIRQLTGRFDGVATVGGSWRQGLTADFDFQGSNWVWGDYRADRVLLKGAVKQNQIQLEPFELQTGATKLSFSGSFSDQTQGELFVEGLSLAGIQQFLRLPVEMQGSLGLSATLSGRLDNPQILGDLQLSNAVFNGTSIQAEQTGFNVRDGRLTFGFALIADDPEPVRVTGSLPLELPFLASQPSDEVQLNLDISNNGLKFLSLLSRDQVQWQGGQGNVQLRLRGTLDAPILSGQARFENARLASPLFEQPLTNLTAQINFAQDRLRVETLSSNFNGGTLTAQGILPIAQLLPASDPDREQPLTIALRDATIALPNLFTGKTEADLQILGSALEPAIAGDIRVNQANIQLPGPDRLTNLASGDLGAPTLPVRFQQLKIALEEGVSVQSEPLFRFGAKGDLTLDGPLGSTLSPNGKLTLTSGQVNLFTSTFVLDRRQTSSVIFRPDLGLDPFLNVNLVASIPEFSGSTLQTGSDRIVLPFQSDPSQSGFGRFQLVRVRAQVNTLASNLQSSIQLTSSPPRSERELLTLIGGGTVNSLANSGGGTALLGLASQALLNNVQGFFNSALGERINIQLFPTVTEVPDRDVQSLAQVGNTNTVLGLGGQIGFDITDDLSVSVLQVLTLGLPTQFNLRYEFTDSLSIRGTTDTAGNNRAVLEFNQRF